MPGGFGTIDELCGIATLVQTRRVPRFPLFVVRPDHRKGLFDRLKTSPLEAKGMVWPGDLELPKLADTPEEVPRIVTDHRQRVGLPESVPEAFRWTPRSAAFVRDGSRP